MPGFTGATGGPVDECGNRDGDQEQHDDGHRTVWLGDGERVSRVDQEVVEQQPGKQRGQCGGRDPAEQCDDEHADEEDRAFTADPQIGVEQIDDHRTDGGRNDNGGKPGRGVTLPG